MLFLTQNNRGKSLFQMDPSNKTAPLTQVPPRFVSVSMIILATFCILLGVFGNFYVLLELYNRQDLRKVPHYLFASLSLTGFLAMTVNMPTMVIFFVVHFLLDHRFSIELVCKTGRVFALTVSILNSITLSVMAIDREDRVVRPFTQRLTPGNIKKVIFIIWMLAAVLTVFGAVVVSQESSACSGLNPYTVSPTTDPNNASRLYTVGVSTLLNVATFLVITITFVHVVKKLRSSSLPPQVANPSSAQTGHQITRLTYQLCTVFLVAWLPLIMVNVVARVIQTDSAALGTLRLFMIVISNFNYVVNPLLHIRMLRARRRIRRQAAVQ